MQAVMSPDQKQRFLDEYARQPGTIEVMQGKKRPTAAEVNRALETITKKAGKPKLPPKLNRWVRVNVPMHYFAAVAQGGRFELSADIPKDAVWVRWFADPQCDAMTFIYEHPSFKEVEDGALIPILPGSLQPH